MKILIGFHSDTGNTEKVAKSMKEGLVEEGQDVTLIPAKEVDPSSLKSYDLVLLGTGVYGGQVGKSLQTIVKNATELPSKMVLFSTHMQPNVSPKFFNRLKRTIEKNNSTVVAEFDCVGEEIGLPAALLEKMLGAMPPEQRNQTEKWMESIKGRPNDKDLEKAKEFAKSLISK